MKPIRGIERESTALHALARVMRDAVVIFGPDGRMTCWHIYAVKQAGRNHFRLFDPAPASCATPCPMRNRTAWIPAKT
ncbi:MAG: hypothetical protein HQL98_10385 [Magnetococcales bacterium]|nr:hypothetical protein [Magnetococcales bacterium]